ncbi:MAG: ABC transporter ATP-binding protein [Nitrospirae bacterium]|nr:ABC transporter ATP-binding protein [Nitrospirota bacterium]
MSTLRKLFFILSQQEKIQILLLAILMLLGAVFETFGIGLLIPFISQLNDPDFVNKSAKILWLYQSLGMTSPREFLIWSCIALIGFFILKNSYMFLLYFIQHRFIYSKRAAMDVRMFKSYLERPYVVHLQRNSAEFLQNLHSTVNVVYGHVILQALTLLTEGLIIVGVCILLISFEPYIALAAFAIFGSLALAFNYVVFRKRIEEYGKKHYYHSGQLYKIFNQSFGAVKEIKVMGREPFFTDIVRGHAVSQGKVDTMFSIINISPRIFIETVTVLLILGIVVIIQLRSGSFGNVLPVLALFAIAAFRLMPSFARVNSAVANIRSGKTYVDELYKDLTYDEKTDSEGSVRKPSIVSMQSDRDGNYIEVSNMSYKYPGARDFSFNDVSLAIPRNSSVAFVGESGAGKTTLADIILGLLKPTEGTVFVDGKDIFSDVREWQRKIGYIPQTINLLDDSIRRNIAFGIPDSEIDDIKVWKALEASQLKSFAEQLPDGLDTFIGERGARLSGGQRQRIGIARALYCEPEVLILDEATSSLDGETESEVMKAIAEIKGKKTIIIIAHRLSTIQSCDTIFEIQSGKLLNTIKR